MPDQSNRTNPTIQTISSRFLLFAAVYGISLILSALFLSDIRYRAALSIPAAIMLFLGVRRFIKGRLQNDRKEQYRVVLSYFLAQASIGRSLEQSLGSARSALAGFYPSRHPLHQTLIQVERQIQANQTSGNTIGILVQSLNCTEAAIGLGILRKLSLSGNALLAYLRQAYQSLADLMEISRDIASQNARTSAEASILAVMPFAMAALLRQSGGYLEPAQNSPAGMIAFGAAYLIAILALSIIPGILSPESLQSKPVQSRGKAKPAGKGTIKAAGWLRRIICRLLGDGLSRRTDEALMRIYSESLEARGQYDIQKLHYLVAGFVLGILFSVSLRTVIVLPFPPVMLIIIQDQLLFRKAKHDELQLLSSFPFFLHICVSLLEAGLTVHHVLGLVSSAFSEVDNSRRRTPMGREAQKINQSLRAGLPVDQVLDQMALQSSTAELRSAYQLLSRYSHLGGQDLLQQLLQQTKVCWSRYRNESRSQLDEQSMKMMLPMMLDLLVILVVAITPAVLFMGSSL